MDEVYDVALMPKHLPVLLAIAGLALTALHVFDLAQSLAVLVSAAVAGVQETGRLDPAEMGAIMGEAIIIVASRGLFALVPATLLFIAWVPLHYRPRWFHRAILAAGFYFTQLFPIGTVTGILLLVLVRRNKAPSP